MAAIGVAVREERDTEERDARPATVSRTSLAGLWLVVAVLEFAMFAPLLRPGTVFLLDSPNSILGPHPHPSGLAWGLPLVGRVSIQAAQAWLYRVLPWGQVRMLPFLLVPPLVAWGFARMFRRDALAASAATVVYVVNPFMYERMVAGQVYLLVGFALLPLLVSVTAGDGRVLRRGLIAGALFAGLVALSPHFAFIAGVVLTGMALACFRRRRDTSLAAAFAIAVGAVLSLLSLGTSVLSSGPVPVGELALFRTAPDPRIGLLPNAIGLYGFWRQGWPLAKDAIGAWPLFLAVLLFVAAVGLVGARRGVLGPTATGLACAGIVGLLIALGDRGPTGAVFRWLFVHVPAFSVMREPQKFLALLALAYAFFFGLGFATLVRDSQARSRRVILGILLLAIPCIYSYRSFWGFQGYVRPSALPASWNAADHVMGEGPEAVLALPWHQYLPFPWTQERVVANPMTSAFTRPTIVGNDPEFGSLESSGLDPRAERVGSILDHARTSEDLGSLLAPLGIRYVALAKVDDWGSYAWLYQQDDLRIVREWPDLTLFEIAEIQT